MIVRFGRAEARPSEGSRDSSRSAKNSRIRNSECEERAGNISNWVSHVPPIQGSLLRANMVPPIPLHFVQGKRGGLCSFVLDGTGDWMGVSIRICVFRRTKFIGYSSARRPTESQRVTAAMTAGSFAGEALLAMIGDSLPAGQPVARIARSRKDSRYSSTFLTGERAQ
jgi:hypothetical protein